MKYVSNINRTENYWNQFGVEYAVWDAYMYFCFLSLFVMQPKTENLWIIKLVTRRKKLVSQNTNEKKNWTYEIPTEKIGPTKFLRDKFLNTRNIHEKKIWAHEISTKKNFGYSNHLREQISDPQSTHESTLAW